MLIYFTPKDIFPFNAKESIVTAKYVESFSQGTTFLYMSDLL